MRSVTRSGHFVGSGEYDVRMEDSNDLLVPNGDSSSARRFPVWMRASVIGVMLLLVGAVVSGMFLY